MISRDSRLFLRRWLNNPMGIGAIMPSSRRLADAMARLVPAKGEGWVVELGGGTGVITSALLRAGVAPERLVVVERDPALHRHLKERFPKVRIVLGDAAHLTETLRPLGIASARAVVSGLPLLSFPRPLQDEIVRSAFQLLDPGGPYIQFTYGPMSPVGRERLGLQGRVAKRVAANLPPAHVWVYHRTGEASLAG